MIADDDKVTLTAHSRKRFEIPPKCKKDCKAYLRKQFFIERILEHWRIRDGRGESLYPRSSSAIKLYEKMKASEHIMGRRTVAGKVVKESYGTAKHQHTFTIEVFWCEGMQKLPPLYPFTSERTESLWVTDLEAAMG
ncbi:hypothetical protein DY000_02037299 [Brassica cretica]|uniref:DUF7699 domain-containing protein n=1 Tax=Brassica cretica TaxID=69181 RepID=A0ABQ7B6D4_BRACR|nr:hypothetical protein DY000_02037299 [Brassica cretica]